MFLFNMTSNSPIKVSRTFSMSKRRLLNRFMTNKLPGKHITKFGYDLFSSQHLEMFKLRLFDLVQKILDWLKD